MNSPQQNAIAVQIRRSGLVEYQQAWTEMRAYTDTRGPDSPDRIWLLQHPSVFTLGQAGKREHLLDPGDIPVLQSDRGGQVTWHGPGQCVAYLLLDLRRLGIGVRELVTQIENTVVRLLAGLGIEARARRDAPGVYVGEAKIAALGLRVRRGCSYHGLSLNVDPELAVFARINPCGYQGLAVTRIVDQLGAASAPTLAEIEQLLLQELLANFGYAPLEQHASW